jgi:glutamate formiminotransferase/formiminotetrahydrofolate cyclodeaminase
MSQGPIVECVPNFSEGRDAAVIAQITAAISAVPGVSLLDVDRGEATNRTVVTFVGPPEAVLEGAFAGIARAAALIDMRQHKGAHPRIGATDVCPFVPVSGASMEDCAELARRLGERVGRELGIPVYLYQAAASRPARVELPDIRAGEYEGLAAKLQDPEWAPDYGPAAWDARVATSGASVIGARPFLIAWNVNLNTKNLRRANKIAALVREKGIYRRDGQGEIVRDAEGKGVRDPGLFRSVKGIGWFIAEYDRCQVSLNLTDHTSAPLHEVYDTIRRVADEEGVVVTGSELVGLVPRDALMAAGHHYLRRQGVNPGAPESEVVETAIRSLGLRDLGPFDADQRIIERRITKDGPLVGATVRGFIDRLSSSAPAPGGGSVAALCGALATSLAAMVSQLTTGKKGYEQDNAKHAAAAVEAQALKEAFLQDIDRDTLAFDGIMSAFGLPKATEADKAARVAAIQAATRHAIEVPLGVLERCVKALDAVEVAATGNKNARSDAGVAALTLRAAAEGAFYNVNINARDLADPDARAAYRARAAAALEAVSLRAERVGAAVRAELSAE